MENFPSNRLTSESAPAKKTTKAPVKKVESVVTGKVSVGKKPLNKRFVGLFFGGDARGAAYSILRDVLIPAAQDMAVDAGNQFIESLFYGESRGRYRRSAASSGSTSKTNYREASTRSVSRPEDPRKVVRKPVRNRGGYDFAEVRFDVRVDAEEVLDNMYELLSNYEVVTVSDFYGLAEITPDFTDENWGWTSLAGANVSRVRGQWVIDLPAPTPLTNN